MLGLCGYWDQGDTAITLRGWDAQTHPISGFSSALVLWLTSRTSGSLAWPHTPLDSRLLHSRPCSVTSLEQPLHTEKEVCMSLLHVRGTMPLHHLQTLQSRRKKSPRTVLRTSWAGVFFVHPLWIKCAHSRGQILYGIKV